MRYHDRHSGGKSAAVAGTCFVVLLAAGAPLLPRRITTKRLTLRDVRHSGQSVRLVLEVEH